MPAPPATQNAPRARTVLIVEDDPVIANLVALMLGKRKFTVVGKVETGEDAIAKVAEHFPDVVLMDIALKGELDGIFSAKYIFNVFNVPVIFITGTNDDETIHRASLAEPLGFIMKPFVDKDLYSNIEMALHNHAMRNRALRIVANPMRKLMDAMDAVLMTDETGMVFFLNSYAEILFQVRAADAVPKNIGSLATFLDGRGIRFEDPYRELVRECLMIGGEKHIAIQVPDGRQKEIVLSARALKDAGDAVIGAIVLIHRKTPAEQRMSRPTT